MNNTANFYIPDFIANYRLNMQFASMIHSNPNVCNPYKIASVYGSFPGMIWNGGRINTNMTFFSKRNIESLVKTYNDANISIRLTCTNTLLTSSHVNDSYGNMVLEILNNSNINEVLVYSDILEEYIKLNYPNIQLLSSTTKCLDSYSELDAELDKDYKIVVASYNLNKSKELLDLSPEKKDRVELLVNESCMPNCQYRKTHYDSFSMSNLAYDPDPQFCCPNIDYKVSLYQLLKTNPLAITAEEIYSYYIPNGFNKFKIVGRTYPSIQVLESYIYYMIKPEYQAEITSKLLYQMQ